MTLPVGKLAREMVKVNGSDVEIRSLSRKETLEMAKFQSDADAGEIYAKNIFACLAKKRLPAGGFFFYNHARPKTELLFCMNQMQRIPQPNGGDPRGSKKEKRQEEVTR